ncbi:Polyadenylate-binding protein [Actinidia chinensis var. chinensis]|uniref:Polyadenylate-binding protein n=1 Tax=Actinidia chinensis var. chinensis TaxID=1590841 RepID=A0A2R6RSK5_ACTCC|nr:Polyadenylate-binding protein [Actinidia chinensis var. chinensis]
MAVVENGSINRTDSHTDVDQSKSNHAVIPHGNGNTVLRSSDPNFHMIVHQQQKMNDAVNHKAQTSVVQHGINGNGVQNHQMAPNGVELRRNGDDGGEGFKREMRDLEEMLSKLNPMAEEFVPPSLTNHKPVSQFSGHLGYANNFVMQTNSAIVNGNTARRVDVKKNNYNQGKRRMNSRTSMAQQEDVIRRTVYVSDIDHQVTEEQLAALFINCGQVVDCRVCGDPNSVLHFAFIEFTDEEGARNALSLALTNHKPVSQFSGHLGYANNFVMQTNSAIVNGNTARRVDVKKNNYNQGKRRMNSRTSMAQQEDVIRRTVYVSDIDHQVTEEQLAALFINCGQVVDCRVCGDPNSVLHFAFIEFTDEEGARNALSLAGTMLGYYPVRVLPSKTAIAPVNPTFLPRSEDEREMCARTIYCTNIDKKVTQADVKLFFESICGEVHRLRLLGDYHHSTRIAFVEFVMAESAIAALNCSGVVLGSLPIRVSPSKTPVRPRAPRPSMH